MVFDLIGKYYDIIYADKDYEKECDFLEELFRRYSKSMPKTILDLGCGTGGHAIPLAKRGYKVTGVDSSEVMINIAKEKACKSGLTNIDFRLMDMRNLQLGRKFDACICMFATFDYLIKNEDVEKALSSIRKTLKDSSLFIFDFWYGPTVLTVFPSARMKIVERDSVRLIRFAEPHLDMISHLCNVTYHLIVIKGKLIIDEAKEEHIVRFFFPEEIKHYLQENGFELLRLRPFLHLDVEISNKDWNAVAICRAI